MSYIETTGKTEEEAISRALAQLGLERDDVSVQILERAKSGFLGLGSQPARIRVTYGTEEKEDRPAPAKKEPAEAPAEQPAAKPAETVPAAVKRAPAAAVQKPAEQRPAERMPESPENSAPESPALQHGERLPEPPLGDEVDDEKAQAIRKFLSGLLEQMECPAGIRVYQPEKGRYKVILEGETLGALIGHRGETLDAIQQLTSYSVNRTGTGRVRVQLDAENYRERREQSLTHLAQKVAGKVSKYHRSVTLEPMNAYERHVIHTALQDVPHITTYSTGTEPNRRVIVAYDREQQE